MYLFSLELEAQDRVKNGETPRNALTYADLKPGVKVYRLCCGNIDGPHTIQSVNDTHITFVGGFGPHYLSDNGIWDAPVEPYRNYLNALFANVEDALEYSKSLDYEIILESHNAMCKAMMWVGSY